MKKFYTLFASGMLSIVTGQNFTIGSIYDHDVGDTIIQEYYEILNNSSPPPLIIMRVFVDKKISPALDTLFYTEKITLNRLTQDSTGFVMSYTNSILSYYRTNLLSSCVNFTYQYLQPCQYQSDTSFVNSCGLNVHIKESHTKFTNQGCFEPSYYKDTYIEKVGVFSERACGNCLPRGLRTVDRFVYSSANKCGESITIVTGVENHDKKGLISQLYPNPSVGVYYFTANDHGIIQVFDITGNQVKSVLVTPGSNTLDLSEQPMGIYLLRTEVSGRSYVTKIIKQ